MALGNWVTNMADPCSSTTCAHCTACDALTYPLWWVDKEIGPARPTSNGITLLGMSGVYIQVTGPVGTWGVGYSMPGPIPPIYFPAVPPIGLAAAPNVTSAVNRLKALFGSLTDEDYYKKTEKFDPKSLLEPLGCKACGSQEKNKHKLMCPRDPARSKPDGC